MKIIGNRKGGIEEEVWIKTVDENTHIKSIHEYENLNIKIYDYAILQIGEMVYGRLLWDWKNKRVEIEVSTKYLSEIYVALLNIATDLDATFYFKSNMRFDPEKHLPIPSVKINRDKNYFESDKLDSIRWMAFREENKELIMRALKFEKRDEILLADAASSQIIFTPAYSGWTFLIGDNLPHYLIEGNENSSEEALTNLCKRLQKLSKKFVEVQYYEHHEKSNITGYFKANNGKFQFGYWKSETEEFIKGKAPKEIRKLHPTTAHEVASVWSVDPLDFMYLKEMADEKCFVLKPMD